MIVARGDAMKTTMAVAVFLMFAASALGQAAQQPRLVQPPQQHAILTAHPRVQVIPIPNWPANKPAPVVQIPTDIQPQSGMVTRAPHFAPSTPSRPCAVYSQNCQLLGGTPSGATKFRKPAPDKVADDSAQRAAAK